MCVYLCLAPVPTFPEYVDRELESENKTKCLEGEFQCTVCTVHNLNCDWSRVSIMFVFEPTITCCEAGEDVVMTTLANDLKLLLLSYCNMDTISYQGVLLSTVIVEPSHVIALTHSTIQDGWTALQRASIRGHHKVVEVLLRSGANPNIQNKVSTGQNRIPS